jgi:hypothetical protein
MTSDEQKGATAPAETWAIVELMGHVRIGGRLTEEERFGVKMGRLDVPNGDAFVTQFFGGASVYRITIVSEEAARAVAVRTAAPVQPWELPKLPAHSLARDAFDNPESEDDPDKIGY